MVENVRSDIEVETSNKAKNFKRQYIIFGKNAVTFSIIILHLNLN